MNLFGQYNASAHSIYLEVAWTICRDFNSTLLVNLAAGREKNHCRQGKRPLQSNDVLIAIGVCSAPVI